MKPVFLLAAMVAGGVCNSISAFAAADPTDAQSAVAPLKYQSPFRDYRVLGDDKRIPWKDANDEVARIGGWRAYAREAQQPAPDKPAAETPPAAVPPTPAPAKSPLPPPAPGHAGHVQPK